MLSKKPYKGTRDFFPEQMRKREYLFEKMREVSEQFAYEPYDGPLLEEVDLYRAKSGEELINDQIYSFIDRGKREVAIRPEMTPTLARMVASIHREVSKPIRWYTIPNLMRYEKPQRGRLREHWQFNCDIFGATELQGEIEILQVLVSLFNNLGASNQHFEVLINDRAIVDAVFKKHMKLEDEVCYKLYKLVDRSKKVSREAFEKSLSEFSFSKESENLFKAYLENNTFDSLQTFLNKIGEKETSERIKTLREQLYFLEISEYFTYDPTIVRGLDYYTGLVFEAFDKNPENRRALCGGGAYGNLLGIFNEAPLPGVGFGLGDVTLTDFLETHKLMPSFEKPTIDLYMSFQDDSARNHSLKLASLLRKNGLRVQCALEQVKFKKVFTNASKAGASFVSILGSDELDKKEIQIKNLETKEQYNIALSDIESIKKILKG